MDTQITAKFCLCDDVLKGLNHLEDRQRQPCDAGSMTTAFVRTLRQIRP